MLRNILMFVVVCVLVSSVYGLGVSPGIVEIDFKPNLETSFQMGIVNYPAKEGDVEVYSSLSMVEESVVEEFREVVSMDKTIFHFTKEESSKNLDIYLKFPEGFSKGGIHELRIGARPYVSSEEGLAILAGNEIRVLVNVPEEYVNEKYKIIKKLKILEISAEDVSQGENANIDVRVKSESEVDLDDVYAEIKVLRQGKLYRTLETAKISIKPGEEKTLSSGFNVTRLSGSLPLEVEVFYGINSVKGEGALRVIGEGGVVIKENKSGLLFWWIIIIIIILLILLLLFLLLRRRREDEKEKPV